MRNRNAAMNTRPVATVQRVNPKNAVRIAPTMASDGGGGRTRLARRGTQCGLQKTDAENDHDAGDGRLRSTGGDEQPEFRTAAAAVWVATAPPAGGQEIVPAELGAGDGRPEAGLSRQFINEKSNREQHGQDQRWPAARRRVVGPPGNLSLARASSSCSCGGHLGGPESAAQVVCIGNGREQAVESKTAIPAPAGSVSSTEIGWPWRDRMALSSRPCARQTDDRGGRRQQPGQGRRGIGIPRRGIARLERADAGTAKAAEIGAAAEPFAQIPADEVYRCPCRNAPRFANCG